MQLREIRTDKSRGNDGREYLEVTVVEMVSAKWTLALFAVARAWKRTTVTYPRAILFVSVRNI